MEAQLDPASLLRTLRALLPDNDDASLTAVAPELAAAFKPLAAPRQAVLLHQGEIWRQALLLETGLVRLHFLQRDGHDFNKNFFAEGSLVCPIAPAMWQEPSLFGITTIEPTRVWRAEAAALRQILDGRHLWLPLQAELLVRLVMGKLQREHDLLALDARARYQTFCQRHPGLAARVPLKHLATYLGITDVSLSRLRRAAAGPRRGA